MNKPSAFYDAWWNWHSWLMSTFHMTQWNSQQSRAHRVSPSWPLGPIHELGIHEEVSAADVSFFVRKRKSNLFGCAFLLEESPAETWSRPVCFHHILPQSVEPCQTPSCRNTHFLSSLARQHHARKTLPPPPSLTDLQVALTHPVIHIEHFKKLFFFFTPLQWITCKRKVKAAFEKGLLCERNTLSWLLFRSSPAGFGRKPAVFLTVADYL